MHESGSGSCSWQSSCAYHGSIPALGTECTGICSPTSGEGVGEDYQADAIDPSKVQHQRSKEPNSKVVHYYVYAEPQGEHLKIPHCGRIMLLFRKYSCDAPSL